ncbi:hypothetical protein [Lysinibacillus irui]|uniref:hypothetical protein n=1 Tax=Lysinibacillus irui TaxID=2998077 RepID=UPI002AD21807|nr:hypothetical protein [Lysinibacillus irui]MEA0564558.1 hypothetical protein [Lysinibacillus irui]
MNRYFIAYKHTDDYNYETDERVTSVDNKKDTLELLSSIISCEDDELISIVHYDFVSHVSKVLKPTLNSKMKLDLVEVEK